MATAEHSRPEQYTTITPQEVFQRGVFDSSIHTANLINKLIQPFEKNAPKVGNQRVEDTRVRVFTNGDQPFSPVDSPERRLRFADQVKAVAVRYSADLLEADGMIKAGKERDWFNMVEIAPALVDIMTDRKSHITMVQQEHTVNLIATALHLARFPDTDLTIKTGIGGSDSDYVSARFAAYAVPAVSMAERIEAFYADRRQAKIRSWAVGKAYEAYEAEHGSLPQDKTEKAKIAEAIDMAAVEQGLTAEQLAEINSKYGLRTKPVGVQFFFAYQAAVAINHTMDPATVVVRAKEGMAHLKEHCDTNHPAIAPNIDYIEDIPWTHRRPKAQLKFDYLVHTLRTSNNSTVKETLSTLESLGGNHGGQSGAERAAEYAAIHPEGFGDRLNLPWTKCLKDVRRNPAINVTIGGRTERHFCAVRQYLSDQTSPEGFIKYVKERVAATNDPAEKQRLSRTMSVIGRWRRMINKRRAENFADFDRLDPELTRPDLPQYGISLITAIGQKPTYYVTEFDRPASADQTEYDAFLAEQQAFYAQAENQTADNALTRGLLEGVIYDMTALRKDQTR